MVTSDRGFTAFPRFDELPVFPETRERHAWGVFGEDDELGTLNHLTDERVARSSRLIESGIRVNLNLPIDEPRRAYWAPWREGRLARTVRVHGRSRDDYLDGFFLQGSSQWDALSHHGYRRFGFYNWLQEDQLEEGKLGIDRYAVRGIFGRGVLLDVAAYMAESGSPIDLQTRFLIDGPLMERVADWADVALEVGDILVVRTAWLEWYRTLPESLIDVLATNFSADPQSAAWPGIDPGIATAGWLWDRRISALAVDNVGVEAVPYLSAEGSVHHRLLAMLGMALGELWDLRELSATCAELERYEFFLASAPLNVPKGAGSPANAYAIF